MLSFLEKFGIFCFLDNNGYDFNKSYECIAGAGVLRHVVSDNESGLENIDQFHKHADDWIFCHVSYDVKNKIEDLHSLHPDEVGFPDYLFFVPEIVFIITGIELKIGVYESCNAEEIYKEIISYKPRQKENNNRPVLQSRFNKSEYAATVKKLQEHILRGDCYEINFCQEFYAADSIINPLDVYTKLVELSPNPFAAFYKCNDKYLICASPERFLKKTGSTIISQPIKGTAKRVLYDIKADDQLKENLQSNEKERSENIMIVDLVRNDLAKICVEGSVAVKDFLQVYSFPQVHQMISTITGELTPGISLQEIFSATFPMGSMSGAPKKKVMELVEKYERTKRGLFSGALGYITPDGDFDFNVVIRSIFYNESKKYVSLHAGSAITFKSNPEDEYEECLLKIAAMKKALE